MPETLKEKADAAGHKIAEAATKVGHKVGEKVEEATDWAKEKAHQVGNRIEEVAQKAEHKAHEVGGKIEEVAHKAEHKANETFGESCGTAKSTADIREHMDVIGSCGNKLGKVDHVQGDQIKLTKNDSPDGLHHLIPMSWVKKVDEHVHVSKNCGEAKKEWQPA